MLCTFLLPVSPPSFTGGRDVNLPCSLCLVQCRAHSRCSIRAHSRCSRNQSGPGLGAARALAGPVRHMVGGPGTRGLRWFPGGDRPTRKSAWRGASVWDAGWGCGWAHRRGPECGVAGTRAPWAGAYCKGNRNDVAALAGGRARGGRQRPGAGEHPSGQGGGQSREGCAQQSGLGHSSVTRREAQRAAN